MPADETNASHSDQEDDRGSRSGRRSGRSVQAGDPAFHVVRSSRPRELLKLAEQSIPVLLG